MQQVKIYIETDSSSPKATEKHYGYVSAGRNSGTVRSADSGTGKD